MSLNSRLTFRCHPVDKTWDVTIADHDGGPSIRIPRLDRVLERVRPLLERHYGPGGDVDSLEVDVQVVIPPTVAAAVRQAIDASERAAELRDEASRAVRNAVHLLIEQEKISLRDTGTLLGLTYERVRQLNNSEEPGRAPRPSGPAVETISSDDV